VVSFSKKAIRLRAILFKGGSAYNALRVFVDDLAEAFASRGFEPVIVDALETPDPTLSLEAIAAGGPVILAFSFNIWGEFRDARGRSIADLIGAPHVVQYVDYPLAGLAGKRLGLTPRSGAVLVVDQSHVDAIQAVYGPDRFAYVGFCPHAAIGGAGPDLAAEGLEAFAARPIPLLFCGTFYKPGEKPWAAVDPLPRKIMDEALEIALASEWTAPMEALAQSMVVNGLSLEDTTNRAFLANAGFIHEHVRAQRRFEFLNAANKASLPLHIYGKGYDQDLYRFKNLTYCGDADFDETIANMRRSRVVVSVNANFGMGSHERPLTAMLSGAAAASDHTTFFADRFREGAEIMLYRWKALDAGLEQLGRLVADPEAAHAMALQGQKRVATEHTSAQRVDVILAAASAAGQEMTGRG
jgi:hypothetical protein